MANAQGWPGVSTQSFALKEQILAVGLLAEADEPEEAGEEADEDDEEDADDEEEGFLRAGAAEAEERKHGVDMSLLLGAATEGDGPRRRGRRLPSPLRLKADLCVVGSGAGGAPVAMVAADGHGDIAAGDGDNQHMRHVRALRQRRVDCRRLGTNLASRSDLSHREHDGTRCAARASDRDRSPPTAGEALAHRGA